MFAYFRLDSVGRVVCFYAPGWWWYFSLGSTRGLSVLLMSLNHPRDHQQNANTVVRDLWYKFAWRSSRRKWRCTWWWDTTHGSSLIFSAIRHISLALPSWDLLSSTVLFDGQIATGEVKGNHQNMYAACDEIRLVVSNSEILLVFICNDKGLTADLRGLEVWKCFGEL